MVFIRLFNPYDPLQLLKELHTRFPTYTGELDIYFEKAYEYEETLLRFPPALNPDDVQQVVDAHVPITPGEQPPLSDAYLQAEASRKSYMEKR